MISHRRYVRLAGAWSVLVSGALLAIVLVHGDVAAMALFTIGAGFIAGIVVWLFPESPAALWSGAVLLFLGMALALLGGVGLLYVPALFMVLWSTSHLVTRGQNPAG